MNAGAKAEEGWGASAVTSCRTIRSGRLRFLRRYNSLKAFALVITFSRFPPSLAPSVSTHPSQVKTTDDNTFFVVAQGGVEVIAVLPTISKKTDNIREFLCKKKEVRKL